MQNTKHRTVPSKRGELRVTGHTRRTPGKLVRKSQTRDETARALKH